MRMFNSVNPRIFFACLIFLLFFSALKAEDKTSISEELASFIIYSKNKNEKIDYIHTLIKDGADPGLYINKFRGSALGNAILLDLNVDLINLLIFASTNINSIQYHNKTPIELAVSKNNHPVIKSLVKAGVDLQSSEGCCFKFQSQPFVVWAIYQKNHKLIELLLTLGANINSYNENGGVLKACLVTQQFDLCKWLIDKGASETNQALLHDAILRNAPTEFMEELLNMGFSAESIGTDGMTAREYAHKRNNAQAIKLFETKSKETGK